MSVDGADHLWSLMSCKVVPCLDGCCEDVTIGSRGWTGDVTVVTYITSQLLKCLQ